MRNLDPLPPEALERRLLADPEGLTHLAPRMGFEGTEDCFPLPIVDSPTQGRDRRQCRERIVGQTLPQFGIERAG